MAEVKKKAVMLFLFLFLGILIGCSEKISEGGMAGTDDLTEKKNREITEQIVEWPKEAEDFSCDSTPTKRQFTFEPYYTGPLIDTHLHMPVASEIVAKTAMQTGFEDMPYRRDLTTEYVACLLDSEGITKAFGFFIMHKAVLESSINAVKKDAAKNPGKFAPFFMPPFPVEGHAPEVSSVESSLENNPGFFQGYGEARFDFSIIENAHPENEYFLEMYRLADEHNLIVQIHPGKGQVAALERIFKKYPNVIFLLHLMVPDRKDVPRLVETYDNVYYSLDAEIHYIFGYHTIQDNSGPTKDEYIASIRKNFDSWLEEAVRDWKPVIEKNPDKFTWGTDRWFTWHFDKEVGALLEEFARSFIGQLDPAVQEKFAYKNAEKMLQER